ncbi:MAG: nucleoside-triphosphatase [Candidatus Paceibacterota bacterium]
MRKNILITGEPRSGKSTILDNIIANYPDKTGFLAKEICKNGQRSGFQLISSNGKIAILADKDINSNHKVSKYYVDLESFDSFLFDLPKPSKESLLYLDEIGQMQLFSDKFREIVFKFLDSPNTCIATITSVFENDFINTIKSRDDVIIVKITPENRSDQFQFIRALTRKIEKAKNYLQNRKRFNFINDKHVVLHSVHGARELTFVEGEWQCTCDFFKDYRICSHVIAIESID